MISLFVAVAAAAEPSRSLQGVTGTGIVVGGIGALTTAGGLAFIASPEPVGLLVFYPPGVVLLGVGTGLTVGGSLAQAGRVDAPPTAGLIGLGLLGAAGAGAAIAIATGTEEGAYIGLVGGPVLAVGALAAGAAQGGVNRDWGGAGAARVALLPDLRRPGARVVGTF